MKKPFIQSNGVGKIISILGLIIAFLGIVFLFTAIVESGAKLVDYYGIAYVTYYFVVPSMGFVMIGLGEVIRLLDSSSETVENKSKPISTDDNTAGGRFAR